MWVLKRREGSVNYIVIWAMVILLLAVGLLGIFLSFLYFFAGITTIVETSNSASTMVAVSFLLVFMSLALSFRQVRQLARLRRLEQMRNNVKSGLRLADSMGVDTARAAELYKLTEAQVGFKDLRETEETMAECNAVLESQLTLYTDRLLEKTKARLEKKKKSTGILFSEDSLQPIEKEIENGNYWEVSRLLRLHRIASDRIEAIWFTLKKARDLGIPAGDDVSALKDVLIEFNQGNLSKSRVDAIRIKGSLDSKVKEFVKDTYVSPAYQKVTSMQGKGILLTDAQQLISDAGTNLLASDIDSSLRLAKTSEEMIDDVTRVTIQESFENLEVMSERAERLGVDVAFVEPRMEIARTDFEEGRLESSLDVLTGLEESLTKDMDFIVVEQFQNLRNSIDMLFLVPEARLELATQLEEADEERKEGNFENAVRLAKKISDMVQNEERESLRAFETSTEKLMEKVKDLEAKGVSTEKIRSDLLASNESVAEKNFANAMEIVLNVTDMVNKDLALHKDSVRTLEELSTLLTRTKEQGADVSDLVGRMEALEDVSELERVLAEAKDIEEQALHRMTDVSERTHVELAKMRDQLHSLLEKNVDVGEIPKFIGEAEKAIDEGNITRADDIISKAGRELEMAIELSERFDEMLSQISETFVTLERAGIPTNVFESDLQHIVTERNEDSLEGLTRFLDEVVSERDRMKSLARQTIEKSSVAIADNPDISFDKENEIIAKATQAYDEGKYSQAFETAVEAVGRTEKKVELFGLSKELCERIEQSLERLGKAGFDIASLESDLQICEIEADPTVRLEKVRALETDVDRTETRLRQRTEWAMVEARHGISLLGINGISSEDLEEMLESAKRLIEDERLRDAEKKARNVRNLAAERVGQFKESKARMDSLEHIMRRAREMDVSLEEYEEDLSWLQRSDDYSHIIEKAGLLYDQINNLFEDRREDVRNSISRLRKRIKELEESGIRAPSVLEAIEKADLEISEDRIIEAMDTCDLALSKIDKVQDAFIKWSGVLVNAEDSLKEAAEAGIGVKDFATRLEALRESGDYEASIPEIDRILDDLDSRRTTMSTRSLEDIRNTREKLEALIEEGAPAGELMELLKDAERSVQEEEFASSRQKITEVAKSTDQLRKDHESFTMVLEQVKAEIDEAQESGLDMSQLLDELNLLRKSEDDYKIRIQLVRDLGEKASSVAENLSLEASQAISEARILLENLKADGTEPREVEGMLSEAEERMGEGNTFEAKRLALEARTMAEEAADINRERNEEYARAKEAMKKASDWGVDISSLNGDLDDALLLSDGAESLRKLRAITEEADSLRLSLSEDVGAKLDGLRMEVQELKGKEIPVSNLDAVIRSAEQLLSDGKIGEVNELVEALDAQKSELEELWTEYSGVKERLRDEMENLEVRKTDMETIQRENSDVESLGVTSDAIERMEALIVKVADVKRELRESTEMKLDEVRKYVDNLSHKGADVEEAISVLYEAEEVLAEDSYLEALAKINRAADVGGNIEKKYTFDNRLLEAEELLKVANEEGIDVGDLMSRLEDLRGRKDFDAMTQTLISIEEETNRRRNGSRR